MARSFFITRAGANSEDPTALEFWPAKGSDELHEALKEAFPYETNLASRMRAAVIEFLLQEQQAELVMPMSTSPEYLPSPQSSFISNIQSPLPSPSINSSHQEVTQPRQQSAAQPSQQALMDVWSLPNQPQAKIHTRRTMTAEEKKAYKQKRIIGACADCKRRRRKCEHTSAAGASSPPRKAVKMKKRASAAAASVAKTDVPVQVSSDFSWTAPTFTMEELNSVPMPTAFDTSFDFDMSTFNFSPDLDNDWELFPSLSTVSTQFADVSPTWSSNSGSFDASLYTPVANMNQQQVSPSSVGHGALTPASSAPMSRTASGDQSSALFSLDPLVEGSWNFANGAAGSGARTGQGGDQQRLVEQGQNQSIERFRSKDNSPAFADLSPHLDASWNFATGAAGSGDSINAVDSQQGLLSTEGRDKSPQQYPSGETGSGSSRRIPTQIEQDAQSVNANARATPAGPDDSLVSSVHKTREARMPRSRRGKDEATTIASTAYGSVLKPQSLHELQHSPTVDTSGRDRIHSALAEWSEKSSMVITQPTIIQTPRAIQASLIIGTYAIYAGLAQCSGLLATILKLFVGAAMVYMLCASAEDNGTSKHTATGAFKSLLQNFRSRASSQELKLRRASDTNSSGLLTTTTLSNWQALSVGLV